MGVTPEAVVRAERRLEALRARVLLDSAARRMDRSRLRASTPYLVGHLIVDLRRSTGWRLLPTRIRSLVGRPRRRRTSGGRLHLPSLEAPRQPGVALAAVRDDLLAELGGALGIVPADPAWFDHQSLDTDLVIAEVGLLSRKGSAARAVRSLLGTAGTHDQPRVLWDVSDSGPLPGGLGAPADVVVVESNARAAELAHSHRGTAIVVVPGIAAHRVPGPRAQSAPDGVHICFAPLWTPARRPHRLPDLDDLLLGAREVGTLSILDDSPRRRRRLRYPHDVTTSVLRKSLAATRAEHLRDRHIVLHAHPSQDRMDPSLFAALTSRTPVVSVPHRGVEEIFGSDVPMPSGRAEIADVLTNLLDPTARDRTAHLGWRRVMGSHSAEHVSGRILRAAGLPAVEDSKPTVDVIIATNRPGQVGFAFDNVRRQLHPFVRPILVAHGDGFDIPDLRNRLSEFPGAILVEMPATRTLGECLNAGVDAGDGDWFAKFDDDDWYGPHYLSDMLLARRITDSAVLGKRSVYMHFESDDTTVLRHPDKEYARIGLVAGPTLLVDRSRLGSIRFPALNVGEDTGFLAACSNAGLRHFSTDRFNFVQMRRANPGSHTWEVDETALRRDSVPVGSGLRLDVVEV